MRSEVEALLSAVKHAGDDPDALAHTLDELEPWMSRLEPTEAEALYEAISASTAALRERRDEVRSQIQGIRQKNRAIRGFGRATRNPAFLRGQRVNRDI